MLKDMVAKELYYQLMTKKKHCIKDFTCRRTWDKTEIIPEIEQKYFSKLSSVYEKASTFINDHRWK